MLDDYTRVIFGVVENNRKYVHTGRAPRSCRTKRFRRLSTFSSSSLATRGPIKPVIVLTRGTGRVVITQSLFVVL